MPASHAQEPAPPGRKVPAWSPRSGRRTATWISAVITMAVAVAIALVVDRFVIGRGARVADRVSRQRDLAGRADAPAADPAAGLRRHPADRRRDRAEPVRQAREARHRPAGLERRDRPGPRLRRADGCWPTRSRGSCWRSPSRSGSATRSRSRRSSGRVDDITLSHTFIDPGDGRLMVVPNEKVVSSIIFNRSTGDRSAPASISVWVPPDADLDEGAGGAGGPRGQLGRRRRGHHRGRADRGPRRQRPRPDGDRGRGGGAARALPPGSSGRRPAGRMTCKTARSRARYPFRRAYECAGTQKARGSAGGSPGKKIALGIRGPRRDRSCLSRRRSRPSGCSTSAPTRPRSTS